MDAAEANSGRESGLDWRYRARNKLVNFSIAQEEEDRLTRMVKQASAIRNAGMRYRRALLLNSIPRNRNVKRRRV